MVVAFVFASVVSILTQHGYGAVHAEVYASLLELERQHEYACIVDIFNAESSMDPAAVGDSGQSHGLPQRHAPAHGTPPSPWPTREQVAWSVEYADARYGGVCAAAEARREKGHW